MPSPDPPDAGVTRAIRKEDASTVIAHGHASDSRRAGLARSSWSSFDSTPVQRCSGKSLQSVVDRIYMENMKSVAAAAATFEVQWRRNMERLVCREREEETEDIENMQGPAPSQPLGAFELGRRPH
jgi:hypothetical protein